MPGVESAGRHANTRGYLRELVLIGVEVSR